MAQRIPAASLITGCANDWKRTTRSSCGKAFQYVCLCGIAGSRQREARQWCVGSGRGGFAPRRGRGYGGRVPFSKAREQVKPDIEKNPLGTLVKTISAPELVFGAKRATYTTEMSACQYVASYNWLNDQVPTIVVPGKQLHPRLIYLHPKDLYQENLLNGLLWELHSVSKRTVASTSAT